MPRSERLGSKRPAPAAGPGPVESGLVGPGLEDSWDPLDDEVLPSLPSQAKWSWHGRPSWGSRLVAVFPVIAVAVAAVLMVSGTMAAQGAIDRVGSVVGTGGATLLSSATPRTSGAAASFTGGASDYRDVTFRRPSAPDSPLQGSTSLSVPPYAGWEANGSAGAANGLAVASGGLLHVGVRHPTHGFRGWFVTATGPTPDSCAFQFTAASPPPVTVSTPGALGELVMAVQTSNTVVTGDINYVVVAENIYPDGRRTLEAGYALGHLRRATEHVVKRANWGPGPLQVAIETNGANRLEVWANGAVFLDATHLHMGIVPPLEPYLEVQARRTAYTVSYARYSSVCRPDVVISNLPAGSVARLGNQRSVVARNGTAVFTASLSSTPVTGRLTVLLPGKHRPVLFAPHTYWPGDRYSFQPGT